MTINYGYILWLTRKQKTIINGINYGYSTQLLKPHTDKEIWRKLEASVYI